MKIKSHTMMAVVLMLLLNASLVTNAGAAKADDSLCCYDEATYTDQMEKDMERLDKLYLLYADKSTPTGKAEKAKREYFKIARVILSNMNAKFDKLDPKTGAALSHSELLLMNHVQVMLLDMLTNIHESAYLLDESDY